MKWVYKLFYIAVFFLKFVRSHIIRSNNTIIQSWCCCFSLSNVETYFIHNHNNYELILYSWIVLSFL